MGDGYDGKEKILKHVYDLAQVGLSCGGSSFTPCSLTEPISFSQDFL